MWMDLMAGRLGSCHRIADSQTHSPKPQVLRVAGLVWVALAQNGSLLGSFRDGVARLRLDSQLLIFNVILFYFCSICTAQLLVTPIASRPSFESLCLPIVHSQQEREVQDLCVLHTTLMPPAMHTDAMAICTE